MGKNIVLIGFMGTGKSTVGFRLAEKLGMRFVDMDKEIEKLTGMTVSQLFRRHGEIRFRSEEKLMAKKLGSLEGLVIATGGGVVLQESNIAYLRENGIIICLEAEPEDIYARVSRKKSTRPLLNKDFSPDDIKEMLGKREAFYSCADLRVNTSGKSLEAVVGEIISFSKQAENKQA